MPKPVKQKKFYSGIGTSLSTEEFGLHSSFFRGLCTPELISTLKYGLGVCNILNI